MASHVPASAKCMASISCVLRVGSPSSTPSNNSLYYCNTNETAGVPVSSCRSIKIPPANRLPEDKCLPKLLGPGKNQTNASHVKCPCFFNQYQNATCGLAWPTISAVSKGSQQIRTNSVYFHEACSFLHKRDMEQSVLHSFACALKRGRSGTWLHCSGVSPSIADINSCFHLDVAIRFLVLAVNKEVYAEGVLKQSVKSHLLRLHAVPATASQKMSTFRHAIQQCPFSAVNRQHASPTVNSNQTTIHHMQPVVFANKTQCKHRHPQHRWQGSMPI